MNLIILTENAKLFSSTRFAQEADKLNIDAITVNPYESSLFLDANLTGMDYQSSLVMHRTTGIRFDDFDLSLAINLEQKNALVLNPPVKLMLLRDKQAQLCFFSNKNIPICPTYSFRGRPNKKTIEDIKYCFGNTLNNSSKFILKTTRGNHGTGVNLIQGEQSLTSLLETFWALKDQKFLIQPYLENTTEYRIFIVDNKVLGLIGKKSSPTDFRNNFGRGDAELISEANFPKDVIDVAGKAFDLSGCFYAAIDLLKWQDKVFLLEMNLVPGFQQMEELTQKNIAKEIILSAKEYMSKKNDPHKEQN